MKARFLGTVAVAAVCVALAAAPAARAGQQEWATAGKILTGVVALNWLFGAPCGYRESRVYYGECGPWRERVEWREYPCEWWPERRPVAYYRESRPWREGHVAWRDGETRTVRSGDGRYAPVYVQRWNDYEGRWVTVDRYPPAW